MKHYETIALRKQYIFLPVSAEEATEVNHHHYEHIISETYLTSP